MPWYLVGLSTNSGSHIFMVIGAGASRLSCSAGWPSGPASPGVYLSIITQAMTYALNARLSSANDHGLCGNNGLTPISASFLGYSIPARQATAAASLLWPPKRSCWAIDLCHLRRDHQISSSARCCPVRDAESEPDFIGYRRNMWERGAFLFPFHRFPLRPSSRPSPARSLRCRGRHLIRAMFSAGQFHRGLWCGLCPFGGRGTSDRPDHWRSVVNYAKTVVTPRPIPNLAVLRWAGSLLASPAPVGKASSAPGTSFWNNRLRPQWR